MAYKDIVVFLDASNDTEDRVAPAVEIAGRHDARLLGIDVSPPSVFEARLPEKDRAKKIRQIFERLVSGSPIRSEFLVAEPNAEDWRGYYAQDVDEGLAAVQGS